MSKKIALVNQRYGLEVNGGSEYYTRLIAGLLRKDNDVEILTTTALNYDTWENFYLEGIQEIEGIKVRRFTVDHKRNRIAFGIFNKLLRFIRFPILESIWINLQGPLSKELVKYIENHKNDYDIFIFITYLYYHTVKGLPAVSDKAILIPTAHDEPYIYFDVYKKIFTYPKAIVYLTEEERDFVNNTFDNSNIVNDVIGIGIDLPKHVDSNDFKEKYHVSEKYIIYAGRIDKGKGCHQLIKYFLQYKESHQGNKVKLVLIGKQMMEIPNNPDILCLGFVSDTDKYNGISGARALILPSEYESLSISVLESMALGIPVLVNGKCKVLKGHCEKSHGGLYYNDNNQFEHGLDLLLQDDSKEYSSLQCNARKYIETNYTWDVSRKKFNQIINKM